MQGWINMTLENYRDRQCRTDLTLRDNIVYVSIVIIVEISNLTNTAPLSLKFINITSQTWQLCIAYSALAPLTQRTH